MSGRPAKNKVENIENKKPIENQKVKEIEEIIVKDVAPIKKKIKFSDDTLISVKSNVFGTLIYINHKTGDEVRWDNFGETQTLSVGDLRAMKAKQLAFYKENWIVFEGIEDSSEEYEDIDVQDIYDVLQVSQYYKDYLCPNDLNEVFNWTTTEMRNKIPRMTKSVREAIAIRANELITEGILDSMSKVKTLEEILNCQLASDDD